MIRVIDLFSGIGGFSLGLESTGGFQTIAFCEIEAFPREVLRAHWPAVPVFHDIRDLRCSEGDADMVVGGFPCQDISVAGKGAGIEGERSGLWSEMRRIVGEVRPRWVLVENVPALRTRGADRVLEDLEALGYTCWPLVVGAWAVGAPHRRERVWIVAHKHGGRFASKRSGGLLDGERAASGDDADGRGQRSVGEPTGSGLEGQRADAGEPQENGRLAGSRLGCNGPRWPARPGEPQHEWEEPRLAQSGQHEPDRRPSWIRRGGGSAAEADSTWSPQRPLGGSVDGLPVRLARRANRESLKALGNSVVPQIVAALGRAILRVEADE